MAASREQPRLMRWLERLGQAAEDADKIRELLSEIRDAKASKIEKEHFYRALAQQSMLWLEEAARGRPFSDDERAKMADDASLKLKQKISELKQSSRADK